MNSVQQQHEYHRQKVLIESFHLSGRTFKFHWTIQDSPFVVKGLEIDILSFIVNLCLVIKSPYYCGLLYPLAPLLFIVNSP